MPPLPGAANGPGGGVSLSFEEKRDGPLIAVQFAAAAGF